MPRDYTARHGDDGDGCCWSLCRCLAKVPCSSFCVLLTLIAGLIGFIGSLLVAFYRTRHLIEQPEIWSWFLYACIGVAVGMLVFGSAFLAVNSAAAVAYSYSTDRQNLCLRVATCIILTVAVVLQVAWLSITVVSAAPLVVLMLFFNQAKAQSRVNLSHYGIILSNKPTLLIGEDLTLFSDRVQEAELLVCYTASVVSAAIVTASLSLILINTTYNYARLRMNRSKENGGGHRISAYGDGIKSTETVLL